MENKSSNNPSRRRRYNRPGGGNRNRRGKQGGRNRRSGGGNRNQGGRNSGGNRNPGGRNRSRRRPEPQPTGFEKFLSTITFGLLGKPKRKKGKKGGQSQQPRKTERQKAAERAAKEPATPKRKKGLREEVTSGRLYVGNLDYEATESDLEELFKGAGNVLSAEVVTNSRTQQSKGFAFVEMGSIDEAKRAVEILDDEDFQGRKLVVSGARSDGPRDSDSDDNGSESARKRSDDPTAAEDADAPHVDEPAESHEDNTSLAETAAEYRH